MSLTSVDYYEIIKENKAVQTGVVSPHHASRQPGKGRGMSQLFVLSDAHMAD